MKTVLLVVCSHKAFDDRVFFKEAVSLAKKYRTIVLSGTRDGFLYDMGGNKRDEGVYSGVEVYGFKTASKKNRAKRLEYRLRRYLHIPIRTDYSALFLRIASLGIRPDVVHLHEPELLSTIPKFRSLFSCKVIFDCHEYHYMYFQTENFSDAKYMKLARKQISFFRKAFDKCDAIISVTKTMEAMNWFLSPTKIHETIQNSTLIHLNQNNRYIALPVCLVHEGAMSFNRGFKIMVEMFSDPWFRENVRLKIIGDLKGDEKTYFEKMSVDRPFLKECIEITGWIPYENLSQYLIGDIGIIFFEKYPNNYLGMPNKLFNYVGAGLPVLAVDLLEVGRVLESFGCGEVATRTIDGIKAAIIKIVSNYQFYLEGIEKASRALSWEYDEEKLFRLYELLLGKESYAN